uniref:Uncharacterized protein n=1 Tax=Anguilla anguilla TaxID=7936 RepID=A0A0E9U4U8_ANGAN
MSICNLEFSPFKSVIHADALHIAVHNMYIQMIHLASLIYHIEHNMIEHIRPFRFPHRMYSNFIIKIKRPFLRKM